MSRDESNREDVVKSRYTVPPDFPSLVPESKEKAFNAIPLVEFNGAFYAAGYSPPEVWQKWVDCLELAEMFRLHCLHLISVESPASPESPESPDIRELDVLEHVYLSSLRMEWCRPAELRWAFRAIAESMSWPVPDWLA